MSIPAYPLTWPPGWKRTLASSRGNSLFINRDKSKLGIADGVRRVLEELRRLGVKEEDVIISTNIRPTLGGRSVEGTGAIPDPGVCVYWTDKQGQRCIAIDRYKGVGGNLGAIAATLEAMRAIERHGGAAILERAFTGFTALPPASGQEQPWEILGTHASAPREEIEIAYRRAAAKAHPDRLTGSHEQMTRVNAAYEAMIARRVG